MGRNSDEPSPQGKRRKASLEPREHECYPPPTQVVYSPGPCALDKDAESDMSVAATTSTYLSPCVAAQQGGSYGSERAESVSSEDSLMVAWSDASGDSDDELEADGGGIPAPSKTRRNKDQLQVLLIDQRAPTMANGNTPPETPQSTCSPLALSKLPLLSPMPAAASAFVRHPAVRATTRVFPSSTAVPAHSVTTIGGGGGAPLSPPASPQEQMLREQVAAMSAFRTVHAPPPPPTTAQHAAYVNALHADHMQRMAVHAQAQAHAHAHAQAQAQMQAQAQLQAQAQAQAQAQCGLPVRVWSQYPMVASQGQPGDYSSQLNQQALAQYYAHQQAAAQASHYGHAVQVPIVPDVAALAGNRPEHAQQPVLPYGYPAHAMPAPCGEYAAAAASAPAMLSPTLHIQHHTAVAQGHRAHPYWHHSGAVDVVRAPSANPAVVALPPLDPALPSPPSHDERSSTAGDSASDGGGAKPPTPQQLQDFVAHFKERRTKLGYTQTDVGVELRSVYGAEFSQATICRFESLQLSYDNLCRWKAMLEKWLALAERRGPTWCSSQDSLVSRKRRRRTTLGPSEKAALERRFLEDDSPTSEDMATIGEDLGLDRRVVRTWFCNQRQKVKRMRVFGQYGEAAATATSDASYCAENTSVCATEA